MNTPSSSLEDKIFEDLEKLWTIGSIGVESRFGHFSSAKDIQKQWLNSQLSLYRQQLLQEFRMGYETGRREVIEETSEKFYEQTRLIATGEQDYFQFLINMEEYFVENLPNNITPSHK